MPQADLLQLGLTDQQLPAETELFVIAEGGTHLGG